MIINLLKEILYEIKGLRYDLTHSNDIVVKLEGLND